MMTPQEAALSASRRENPPDRRLEAGLHAVLAVRERRAALIKGFAKVGLVPLVVATMNIPGPQKSSPVIQRAFDLAVQDLVVEMGSTRLFLLHKEAPATGPFAIFYDKAAFEVSETKEILVGFEDTHPIGRWMDLDAYSVRGVPLGRSTLGLPARRCFLCDDEATVCRRLGRHPLAELYAYTLWQLSSYVETCGLYRLASL